MRRPDDPNARPTAHRASVALDCGDVSHRVPQEDGAPAVEVRHEQPAGAPVGQRGARVRIHDLELVPLGGWDVERPPSAHSTVGPCSSVNP